MYLNLQNVGYIVHISKMASQFSILTVIFETDPINDSLYTANYFLLYFTVFILPNIDMLNKTRGISGFVYGTLQD